MTLTCNCLCPVIEAAHDCTGERSVVLTITGNAYTRDGHEIGMCASCADAWQVAKPHRVISRRVSLEPALTSLGMRA